VQSAIVTWTSAILQNAAKTRAIPVRDHRAFRVVR
jgi:hypothetical protein